MKKILLWSAFILTLLLAAIIYWKYFYNFSDGYRAGLLQKFSRKGVIFKTYEGEMILSSVESTEKTTLASEKFFFSVTDEDLARQFEQIQGRHVVIHYSQKNSTLPWRGDTRYLVDSVRLAEHQSPL